MRVRYYSGTDMLSIRLASRPSTESEEVLEGFVFDFDAEGKVVRIEVDNASRRVDLREIQADAAGVVDDAEDRVEVYLVTEVAEQLGVSVRAIQKTLQSMKQAGLQVGRSRGNTSAILLTAGEVARIGQWRAEHRRGRPGHGAPKTASAVHM